MGDSTRLVKVRVMLESRWWAVATLWMSIPLILIRELVETPMIPYVLFWTLCSYVTVWILSGINLFAAGSLMFRGNRAWFTIGFHLTAAAVGVMAKLHHLEFMREVAMRTHGQP